MRLRTIGLVVLWAVFVTWAVVSYRRDPYNPLLTGTAAYGHNSEGALAGFVKLSLIELAIAAVLLQPWRRAPNRNGTTMFIILCGGWTLLCCITTMHAGSVVMIHGAWVFALLVYGIAVHRRRPPLPAAPAMTPVAPRNAP